MMVFIPSPEIIDKTGCELLTCLVITTEDRFATLAINPDKGRTAKINKLQIVGHISELNKQNQQVMVVTPVKPIAPITDTETNDLHTLKFKTSKDFQVCLNIGHESMKKEDLKSLRQTILNYTDIFAKCQSKVGPVKGEFSFEIQITDPSVICHKSSRMTPMKLAYLKKEIVAMLQADIIEPSTSPYSNRIMLVEKPNGEFRVVVDFRDLNKISRTTKYNLPRIQELIERLTSMKIFSVIDMKSAYHSIPLTPFYLVDT